MVAERARPWGVAPIPMRRGERGMVERIGEAPGTYGATADVPEWYQQATQSAISCPKVFLRLLGGDAKAAVFLSQCLYLSRVRGNEDGWFYMDADEWEAEIGYTNYEVARCCKVLAAHGLEVWVKGVKRVPTRHFRVNVTALQTSIHEFLQIEETDKCKKLTNAQIEETASHKLKKLAPTNARNFNLHSKAQSTPEITQMDAHASSDAADAAVADDMTSASDPAIVDTTPPKPVRKPRTPKAAPAFAADSREYKIAVYLRATIHGFAPEAKLPSETTGGLASWCEQMRLMLEVDRRQPVDIRRVLDWLPNEPFWHPHILSAKKLREKFDTLLIQSKRGKGDSNGQSQFRRGSTIGQAPTTADGYAKDRNDVIE